MQTLAKLYENPFTSSKVFLIKYLFNMEIEEGESISYHLNEFTNVTTNLCYVFYKINRFCKDLETQVRTLQKAENKPLKPSQRTIAKQKASIVDHQKKGDHCGITIATNIGFD